MRKLVAIKRKLQQKRPTVRKTATVVGSMLLLVLVVRGAVGVSRLLATADLTPATLISIVTLNDPPIRKHKDMTHILLLGMAGGAHAGGDLADTLLVVTLDFRRDKLFFLSVPRDIWVLSLQDKVNAAYHYGSEQAGQDGGILLAKAAVEEVTGLPIHYSWRIDFAGFEQIIDTLGGVDIVIEQGFTDNQYPIDGRENDPCDGDPTFACRYETVTFAPGAQRLGGAAALKYVRSRHAEGFEGTDIARGKRQQQVLSAVVSELTALESITNVTRNRQLLSVVQETSDTDMSIGELLVAARMFLAAKDSVTTVQLPVANLSSDTDGVLINPPLWQYDGRWVLIPPNEEFTRVHDYLSCLLDERADCDSFFVGNSR